MKYFQSLLSHWSTYAGLVGMVISFETPSINAYIAAHPHTTFAVLLGAAVAAYHMSAPKDKPSANEQGSSPKIVAFLFAMFFALAGSGSAQAVPPTPAPLTNFYAAGVSYNNSGSPSIAGTGLYARKIDDVGTYAFTVVDALPTSLRPFTVTSNFSAGVAQKIFTIGKVPIFVPTSAGVSYNGSNTGWAWSTGALASIRIKNNWRIFPHVRVLKSSVSNGSGYQPVVGVMVGWGK